jgi:hypothetical protein
MELLCDVGHVEYCFCLMWNLVLVGLATMLVLVQVRSMVCAEHTAGLEIILDAHDGNAR